MNENACQCLFGLIWIDRINKKQTVENGGEKNVPSVAKFRAISCQAISFVMHLSPFIMLLFCRLKMIACFCTSAMSRSSIILLACQSH